MSGARGARPDDSQANEIARYGDSFELPVRSIPFANKPSPHTTFQDIQALIGLIETLSREGAAGIVVTHGTDTLEDTAFVLDVSLSLKIPVVMTGAMRAADQVGADGPANLLAALRLAAMPGISDYGILAVLHDQIHAARLLSKSSGSAVGAFSSPGFGPLGLIVEGHPQVMMRPRPLPKVKWQALPPEVVVLTVGMAQEPMCLERVRSLPPAGVVIAGLGGGHVPETWIAPLTQLAEELPCILASRCVIGDVLRSTYAYPGSEMDLLKRGLISAHGLSASKARLLLSLLLAGGATKSEIKDTFDAV